MTDSKVRLTLPDEIGDCLTGRWGFERCDRPDAYLKVLDAQHSLVIEDAASEQRSNGKMKHEASLLFGVARKDINELWREIINPDWSLDKRSVPMDYTLLDGDLGQYGKHGHWSLHTASHTEAEVVEYFDLWVPKLEATANLPFMNDVLESLRTHERESRSSLATVPRMMNIMLDGEWDDAAHDEFLAWRLKAIEDYEPGHRRRVGSDRIVPLIKEWLKEHPNGIDRELTGPNPRG